MSEFFSSTRLLFCLVSARVLFMFLIVCAEPVLADNAAVAAPTAPPIHDAMNGISYATFGDFFKKWHFVTARYRKDTGEMRFIYANDIAWKALKKGDVKDYPEGAAFGKVGIATAEDKAFTNSVMPSGAQRYQIMLRQHKKYPETQGWTYAIFMNDHKVHGADSDAEKSAACAACHAIVPDRGYVFSQPISLGLGGALNDDMPVSSAPTISDEPAGRISFRTIPVEEFPETPRAQLPPGITTLRLIEGAIAEHVFVGTLDEIRPALAREAMRSHMPAALVSKDGSRYSMVFPASGRQSCMVPAANGREQMPGQMLAATYTAEPDHAPSPLPVRKLTFCQALP
jgi:hypothetical protein